MLKKSLFLVISVITPIFAASAVNPELVRLMNEKNKKMAQLEQCAKKVHGFKIAGISTLGITAAGAVGNVMLHKKQGELNKQIATTKKNIETEKQKQVKLDTDIENTKKQYAECRKQGSGFEWKNGVCTPVAKQQESTNVNSTTTAVTYEPVITQEKPKIGDTCISADDEPFLEAGIWQEYDRGEENCVNSDGARVACFCGATKCFGDVPVIEVGTIKLCQSPDGVPSEGFACSRADLGEHVKAGKWVVQSEKTKKFCIANGKAFYCACSATECESEKYELFKTGEGAPAICREKDVGLDYSPIKNHEKTDTYTQKRFCGQILAVKRGEKFASTEEDIKNQGGMGYWCETMGGKFVVDFDKKELKCDIDISSPDDCDKRAEKITEGRSNGSALKKTSKQLLIDYKNYSISCDNNKDVFKMLKIDGSDEDRDRLKEVCKDKGGNWSYSSEEKDEDGVTYEILTYKCKDAKGC